MSRALKVVAVSGSLHHPSKTTSLVEAITAQLESSLDVEVHLIRLDQLGPHLAGVLRRDRLPAEVEAELVRIETADLLVVASPVYRASFTGLLKHLFDFVDQYALVDTPVLLAATGGSERHALIIDHQFRPLFSFFQALTLPLGVYAHDSDFLEYRVQSELLLARIRKVVERSTAVISSSFAEKEALAHALR
ncbi:MAG TPA: FMN reductase [Pseudolysinimonas sp.]|nr:FMN reductase [Pseudolysinimonas sp.]